MIVSNEGASKEANMKRIGVLTGGGDHRSEIRSS